MIEDSPHPEEEHVYYERIAREEDAAAHEELVREVRSEEKPFNKQELLAFFRTLWGDEPSTVFLSLKNPGDDGVWDGDNAFKWPEDRHKVCRFVKRNRDLYDVYMTPATFQREASGRKAVFAQASRVVWIDVDKGDKQRIREEFKELGGFVVNSGSSGNFHGYIPLKEAVEPHLIEDLNNRLKTMLGGDDKQSTSSVLRVPGTTNHKSSGGPVTIDDANWLDTRLADAEDLKSTLPEVVQHSEDIEDFDLSYEEVHRIPPSVQSILDLTSQEATNLYDEKRSGAVYHFITTAVDFGLSPGQIAALMVQWDVAKKKYRTKTRILEELQRILKKYHVEVFNEDETDTGSIIDVTEIQNYSVAPFMIQNFLPEGGFSLLTGHSGTGKSFIAADLAARVAFGMEYAGRKVKKNKVLYIAMEGQAGLINRIRAWLKLNDVTPEHGDFKFILKNFSFVDEKKFGRLLSDIRTEQPQLIVIDTVAHAMSGWEENSATEMGAFISRVSEIEGICGSTTLLIHHLPKATGKGEGSRIRARGSGALPAAANAVFETDKAGSSKNITVTATKQKDIEHPKPLQFVLESVDFGDIDEFGDPAPLPAVAVYQGEASSEEVKMTTAAKEIYQNFLSNPDRPPVSKTKFVEDILGKGGKKFQRYTDAWSELVEWGVFQEHPYGQWSRCDLAHNHAERWTAWLNSPMISASAPAQDGEVEQR